MLNPWAPTVRGEREGPALSRADETRAVANQWRAEMANLHHEEWFVSARLVCLSISILLLVAAIAILAPTIYAQLSERVTALEVKTDQMSENVAEIAALKEKGALIEHRLTQVEDKLNEIQGLIIKLLVTSLGTAFGFLLFIIKEFIGIAFHRHFKTSKE